MQRLVRVSLILFCSLMISGCATWDEWDAPVLEEEIAIIELPDLEPEVERVGIYHQVNPGETLWRIAKTYRVPVNELVDANNIPDAGRIEKNQLVFIPGAEAVIEIPLTVDLNDRSFEWPVKGKVLTYFKEWKGLQQSKGIDIRVSPGDKINASRSGRVVFADFLSGYGQTIILNHEDGYYSVYAQNADLLVKLGDIVNKRMAIAEAGYSDKIAHVHFQIRKNAVEDNPLFYLP